MNVSFDGLRKGLVKSFNRVVSNYNNKYTDLSIDLNDLGSYIGALLALYDEGDPKDFNDLSDIKVEEAEGW